MQDKLIWTRDKFQVDLVFFPLYEAVCSFKRAVGDRPQGVAGDCNSLAETHAWFDSRVAHHLVFLKPPTTCLCGRVSIFQWVMGKWCARDLTNRL
jgi:hypothetical protein